MRILIVHNVYQEPGGEDRVVVDETRMLEDAGHTVLHYGAHNDDVGQLTQLRLAARTVWSQSSYDALARVIDSGRPDVMHVHNTLPLISPSAYFAASRRGVAVVQTLHNFRLLCPNALLFRDGAACEECLGRAVPWPAIQHGCYRGNRAATAAIVAMLTMHRAAGTYGNKVDAFIAPSEFVRRKFVENGFPDQRVIVNPHVVYPDRGIGNGSGGYALYVGRLSAEKGVPTLLAAWQQLRADIPLLVVGDGPLAPLVIDAARTEGVIWLGQRPADQVHDLLARARCLVLPSECYETFGRVAAEAYAAGTPVIAANGGSIRELVSHERTGLLFEQGSADDLVRQVRLVLRTPTLLREMRLHARAEYEARYSAAANVRELLTVYRRAIVWRGATRAPSRYRRAHRAARAVKPPATGRDVRV